MLATQAILCATVLGNVALLIVVLRERASLVRIVFLLYVSCIAAWASAIYLNLFLGSLFVEEIIFAAAAGMLTAQYWFAKVFPAGQRPANFWEYWSLAVGLFFVAASFYPDALFTSITVHPEGFTTLDTGPLSTAYSLFALVYVFAPAILFFRKLLAHTGEPVRRQLTYLSIGFTISLVVELLTNSILPIFFHIFTFNAVGPAFSLVFASIVFYIISKHRFLDIRKAIIRGAIYLIVIGGILIADIVFFGAAEQYLESIQVFTWIHTDDVVDPLTAIIITAIGIATVPIIEKYFQKITDRIFFKDRYNYASALEALSAALSESVDFDELIQRIRRNLAEILRAESVDVVLYDATEGPRAAAPQSSIFDAIETLRQSIVVNHEEIGCIVVGPKNSGDNYRHQDELLLRTFALQASTALARVQLFMQVRRHADELEEKIAERTAQLKEMHESERHMLLDIAHGLQTPLTIFRSKLERIRASTQESAQVGSLEQSLVQLSEFVDDLLRLAQLERSQQLSFERCDLSALLQELCDETETIVARSGVRVQRSIEPRLLVHADTRELRSAIMNITSNSIKYMRDTDPKEMYVSLVAQNDQAVLSIRDTGCGIAPEDLPRIFDRFFRARNATASGNGLGLPLTKRTIERHGGTIEAASEIGVGTTITIRLPLVYKPKKSA